MKLTYKLLALAAGMALLGGCATKQTSLYQWENYQPEVYEYFKAKTGPEEQIAQLEESLEKIRAKGHVPPPGFHAHLGMLYAQVGSADKAIPEFKTEKELFPESATYMDLLLSKYSK